MYLISSSFPFRPVTPDGLTKVKGRVAMERGGSLGLYYPADESTTQLTGQTSESYLILSTWKKSGQVE